MLDATGGGGPILPPDLQPTPTAAADAAQQTAKDSWDVTVKLPLTRANKQFNFWF